MPREFLLVYPPRPMGIGFADTLSVKAAGLLQVFPSLARPTQL